MSERKENRPLERNPRTPIHNTAETGEILFRLKDKTHEFTVGLGDVIDCIGFAESQCFIPELPASWLQDARAGEHHAITEESGMIRAGDLPARAELLEDVIYEPEFDDTYEKVLFTLRDATGTFMMGLSEMLECIRFAGSQGYLPRLPETWWYRICDIYPGFGAILAREYDIDVRKDG